MASGNICLPGMNPMVEPGFPSVSLQRGCRIQPFSHFASFPLPATYLIHIFQIVPLSCDVRASGVCFPKQAPRNPRCNTNVASVHRAKKSPITPRTIFIIRTHANSRTRSRKPQPEVSDRVRVGLK